MIRWSQPEIAVYADDIFLGLSYPNMIEDDGRCFISETQKTTARVHEIDPNLLEGLWGPFEAPQPVTENCVLDLPGSGKAMPDSAPMPVLKPFCERNNQWSENHDPSLPQNARVGLRAGFSLVLELSAAPAGTVFIDARDEQGRGFALRSVEGDACELVLSDGITENHWRSDAGTLSGEAQKLAVIVDGGPKIILFVVDGVLCDGNGEHAWGWGRSSERLMTVNWADAMQIGPQIASLKLYDRALRVSEAVALTGQ